MTNQPWKLVLLLIGIFVAGAVSGGFVTLRVARHMMPKPHSPENWGPARLKKLSERLSLTPEQEEKVKPIMKRDMDDLSHIRVNCMAEAKRIFARMEHDIAEVLTPEQRTKFDQMNHEMRERMQKFMKDRPFGQHEGPHQFREHSSPPEPADGPPPPADELPPPDKPPGGV